jgi:hypothetical protein
MNARSRARILAMVVLIGAIAVMATDYIHMTGVAIQHIGILQAELDKIPSLPQAERIGMRQTYKSRFAAVRARYSSAATAEQVFDHYARILASAQWRVCGRTESDQTLCRGEYEAVIAVPSSDGPGSYSVALLWNAITWRVWLSAAALIFLVAISAAILLDHRSSVEGRGPDMVRLSSRLPVADCLRRLDAAEVAGMIIRRGPASHVGTNFELRKGGGRLTSRIVRPYFYGRLEPDPTTEGTILAGRFGASPEARKAIALSVVMFLLAFALAYYGPPGSFEGALWVVAIPTVGLLMQWWASRREQYAILDFLNTIVSNS